MLKISVPGIKYVSDKWGQTEQLFYFQFGQTAVRDVDCIGIGCGLGLGISLIKTSTFSKEWRFCKSLRWGNVSN